MPRTIENSGEPVDVYFTVVVEFYLAHDAW